MEFEDRIKARIRAIPRGRVATYAQIAALAGDSRGAHPVRGDPCRRAAPPGAHLSAPHSPKREE